MNLIGRSPLTYGHSTSPLGLYRHFREIPEKKKGTIVGVFLKKVYSHLMGRFLVVW